jgi:hypothetical protein
MLMTAGTNKQIPDKEYFTGSLNFLSSSLGGTMIRSGWSVSTARCANEELSTGQETREIKTGKPSRE